MESDLIERLAIRDVVENWVVWSDAGNWELFRTVWHGPPITDRINRVLRPNRCLR